MSDYMDVVGERDYLRDELNRTRKALTAIRDHPEDDEWHTVTDAAMREIARAALAKEAGK